MKRYLTIFFIAATLFSFNSKSINAQTDSENSVKITLNKILDFSKSKSYEKASGLIAYSGDDKTKYLKNVYDSSNKDELNQVKRICKKISALLDISDTHNIDKIESMKIEGLDGYKAIVSFVSGTQKLETSFEFISINQNIVLFNMN